MCETGSDLCFTLWHCFEIQNGESRREVAGNVAEKSLRKSIDLESWDCIIAVGGCCRRLMVDLEVDYAKLLCAH